MPCSLGNMTQRNKPTQTRCSKRTNIDDGQNTGAKTKFNHLQRHAKCHQSMSVHSFVLWSYKDQDILTTYEWLVKVAQVSEQIRTAVKELTVQICKVETSRRSRL